VGSKKGRQGQEGSKKGRQGQEGMTTVLRAGDGYGTAEHRLMGYDRHTQEALQFQGKIIKFV
jgi:hypothetical protein